LGELLTITEEKKVASCYGAHGQVEGLAPEPEKFLHDALLAVDCPLDIRCPEETRRGV
jgi:hypothetical protein